MPSAIWSSLHTLNVVKGDSYLERGADYILSPPIVMKNDRGTRSAVRRGGRSLADLIANLAVGSPSARDVSACAIELKFNGGKAEAVVRIAQNGGLPDVRLEGMRSILLVLEEYIINLDTEAIWSEKAERDNAIFNIAYKMLFMVVALCTRKIDSILARNYSQPFLDWYQVFTETNNLDDAGVAPEEIEQIAEYLKQLHVALEVPNTNDARARCIVAAHGLYPYLDDLEPVWSRFAINKETEGDEEEEDRQSLSNEELRKSKIYRLLKKLADYFIACLSIVANLLHLSRLENPCWDFKIERVPLDAANMTCSPQQLGEYSNVEEFFAERLKERTAALNGKSGIVQLRDTWSSRWETKNLFLHAEMQLALYYALNPHIIPLHDYIGLLTFGRRLQHDAPDIETFRPPLTYSVRGTHGRQLADWVFPDPAMYPELIHSSITEQRKQEIMNTFKAVRDGLEKELVQKIKDIICCLQETDYMHDWGSSAI